MAFPAHVIAVLADLDRKIAEGQRLKAFLAEFYGEHTIAEPVTSSPQAGEGVPPHSPATLSQANASTGNAATADMRENAGNGRSGEASSPSVGGGTDAPIPPDSVAQTVPDHPPAQSPQAGVGAVASPAPSMGAVLPTGDHKRPGVIMKPADRPQGTRFYLTDDNGLFLHNSCEAMTPQRQYRWEGTHAQLVACRAKYPLARDLGEHVVEPVQRVAA